MSDEIRVSDGQVFRPRYDAPAKDLDRLQDHMVELLHAGEIERVVGTALFDSHIRPAFDQVLDGYFDRGLYDQIEAYLTPSDVHNAWPYEGDLVRWRQLAEAGQTRRVVRLWRNHIACVKVGFWYRIGERTAGYRKPKFSGMSDAADRNSHANLIGQISTIKEDILGLMAFARHWFEWMDVPQAELTRLATERAEVEAEERRRPDGKPDPRSMDTDVFWEIIGTPEEHSLQAHVDAIVARLERFKASAIKAFDKRLQALIGEAYRADIWGLAYLLRDGCSDDDFAAFRCWLVVQGRDVFEATLRDPDAFDTSHAQTHIDGALALMDAPLLAYEVRTGTAMKRTPPKTARLQGDDLAEDEIASRLPRVAARLAAERT
ncbi:MAG: DUF4240 domain-containing protein [Pseudomonadota bacterium]